VRLRLPTAGLLLAPPAMLRLPPWLPLLLLQAAVGCKPQQKMGAKPAAVRAGLACSSDTSLADELILTLTLLLPQEPASAVHPAARQLNVNHHNASRAHFADIQRHRCVWLQQHAISVHAATVGAEVPALQHLALPGSLP
jgi:hypothetical protein